MIKYQIKKVFALSEMPEEIQAHIQYYETCVIFEISNERIICNDINDQIEEWLLNNGAELGETVLIW